MTSHHRTTLFLLLCAAALPLGAQQSRAVISLPGYLAPFRIEDVAVPYSFDAPAARVYAAVKASFDEMRIPLTVDDTTARLVGNGKLEARANFSDVRLSRLFDCGASATGQNADNYRLSFVLLVLYDADGPTRTKVQIGFVAGGQDLTGMSKVAVTCGSTGKFEEKVQGLIAKHLR
jgi:hypothetical protein